MKLYSIFMQMYCTEVVGYSELVCYKSNFKYGKTAICNVTHLLYISRM